MINGFYFLIDREFDNLFTIWQCRHGGYTLTAWKSIIFLTPSNFGYPPNGPSKAKLPVPLLRTRQYPMLHALSACDVLTVFTSHGYRQAYSEGVRVCTIIIQYRRCGHQRPGCFYNAPVAYTLKVIKQNIFSDYLCYIKSRLRMSEPALIELLLHARDVKSYYVKQNVCYRRRPVVIEFLIARTIYVYIFVSQARAV